MIFIVMTTIKLSNESQYDVLTYITLGATEGCVQDVTKLKFSDPEITIKKEIPLRGYFNQKAKTSTYVEAPEGMGFNANISYNSPPQNCSSHDFPNGINLAEFIVNNPFQGIYGQETIDISCVAGANAKVKFTMTADDWTSDYGSITKIKSFENNEWDNNAGLVGVFPYGCDNCTSSDNPPSCVGKQPEYVNKKPICNVQRPCEKNDGGEIEIILVDLLKM
jgi:hypothetical protein